MSDKNIKLSRNTRQYIESIVYVLCIITVIFANTYGSIYIKMFPTLIILGIVGKMIFGRPVITTVFGIVMATCINYIKGNNSLLEIVVVSFSTGLSITLGELIGKYLKIVIKRHKNKKSVSKAKYKGAFSTTICLSIISIMLNSYINGNIWSYIGCEKALYSYLDNTYGISNEFKITDVKYDFISNPSYVMRIKNTKYNQINKFVIYLSDRNLIQDGYKQSVLTKNNNNLELALAKYIDTHDILNGNTNLNINMKYRDLNKIQINIVKEVNNISDENTVIFSSEVDKILKNLSEFGYYNEII